MAKNRWTNNNIGDLTGQIAIITGANTGLGKETAAILASKNATVIMAVRNTMKGEKAALEIQNQFIKSKIRVMELDLSSLRSIKGFAHCILKEYKQINYLINNAGVMVPPYSKTEDGFELQFGTNHLGHFALTGHLIAILKATPNSRIVNVSSIAHSSGNIDFDDLNWEKREYNASSSYGDSKIANLYFTYELARKVKESDLKVIAAHPGWTATDLQRNSGLFSFLNPFFAQKPAMGALPTLRAAIDPEAQNGDYFGPDGFKEIKGYPVKVESNELSHDGEIAARLWHISEEMTGVNF
ncbi:MULTISPECIES: oxidoreductase [unclassified Oceanispirochaeta]|uniref:oxidoreductase n=1 Tax=unclassified Oceanispirochaeta TaxID=2635722 RepID=UPI000E093421|nr:MULTISPECIES: oxidoreductase [unclassified Oceanispirochaeta]MBF9018402.1 SDR family NAD(P)-dependent oxidoreductase [Oceanispirochaeta sp. M2]NPD75214.1 SDR family NAD(P)-dependent oxidoreductase [Oceanispirochaeta sp. M1]RDG28931.1 SDR family NAD(P)-dependent oxidoreductase [Oceanispirochaeta sp. M1]